MIHIILYLIIITSFYENIYSIFTRKQVESKNG